MSARRQVVRLDTVGRIAMKLEVPVHRVEYILRSRGIDPVAYAGHLRLFDRVAVDRVQQELKVIDSKRPKGGFACR